ncbi:MAG: hypothetical protein DCC56_02155 [Anaerolineae bacterium]|nr:MAG: hypothetical protein DCC56_02155 [Anaerolineae bacterium]
MTCILHEVGSPIHLMQRHAVKMEGRTMILQPSMVGTVRKIYPSNHSLDVYFQQVHLEINLPADLFEKPHKTAQSYPVEY